MLLHRYPLWNHKLYQTCPRDRKWQPHSFGMRLSPLTYQTKMKLMNQSKIYRREYLPTALVAHPGGIRIRRVVLRDVVIERDCRFSSRLDAVLL